MKIDELKGIDESFMLRWQEKFKRYEATVPGPEKWSDNIKTIMLENFVALCPHLTQVKEMAE